MKKHLGNKIYPGFGLALAILILLGIYVYTESKNFLKSSKLIAHTHEVLYHLEQVLSITINIETGQRGYCLTKDEKFLQPNVKNSLGISDHINELQALVSDNIIQVKRVDELRKRIFKKLNFCNEAIELRKILPLATVWDSNYAWKGQVLMDSIRNQIAIMQQDEKRLLKDRTEANEKELNSFNFTFIGLFCFFLMVLVLLFMIIILNDRALKKASNEIFDLYNKAPCGYHSIDAEGILIEINDTELDWLGYTRDQVVNKIRFVDLLTPESKTIFADNFEKLKNQGYINNLEFVLIRKDGTPLDLILNSIAVYDDDHDYVKSRSTLFDDTERRQAERKISQLNTDLGLNLSQLETTNKELESFAYSVSHDLRAPLRSIDGYTKILFEDYNEKFDDEGKRVLNVVMKNARKMGQLIDDLLAFSRLGRTELVKENINMTAKVEYLIIDAKNQNPDRELHITLKNLESSMADRSMVTQVWINLISNAVKYSRKKEKTMIEIGSYAESDRIVYYVKDNGVGFDMNYSHKLFGVFQRLHKMEEFEGTGVGLAIVHRVIIRHGGEVWAEGKINEGATFYFSLPKS